MKRVFLILFLLAFLLSTKAQTELFGKYQYLTESIEKSPFNYTLNLNGDRTFLIEDSTTETIATGTWKAKNDHALILSFDSKKSVRNRRTKYFIKYGQLHEEIMTKRQYNRQTKKLDKLIKSCLPGMWEGHETFKAIQENLFLVKVGLIQCS